MNNSPFIFNPVQPVPRVPYYANLPDATQNYSNLYYVENSSGIWFINYHSAGFYRSNGIEWLYETNSSVGGDVIFQDQVVLLYGRSAAISTYAGAAAYINEFGTLINAQADAVGTSSVAGIIINKPTSTTADLLISGLSPSIFSGLTIGATYFLSPSVAGGITTSVPAGAGETVLSLGIAISDTELLVSLKNSLIRAL